MNNNACRKVPNNLIYRYQKFRLSDDCNKILHKLSGWLQIIYGSSVWGKYNIDVLFPVEKQILADVTVQLQIDGDFRHIEFEKDEWEKVEILLLRLYRKMDCDTNIPEWNKARLIFDIESNENSISCRWDKDFQWLVDKYLRFPSKSIPADIPIRTIMSWRGIGSKKYQGSLDESECLEPGRKTSER